MLFGGDKFADEEYEKEKHSFEETLNNIIDKGKNIEISMIDELIGKENEKKFKRDFHDMNPFLSEF